MKNIENIKNEIEFIPKTQAIELRNKYIERFIDSTSDHYKKNIATVTEHSDGICYDGYLWECTYNYTFSTFENLVSYRNMLNKVIILWDIHSKDKIWIPDYWRFGKDSILKLNYNILLDHLNFFPDDLYIFDNTYEWTFILTHEDDINGNRICLKIGNI